MSTAKGVVGFSEPTWISQGRVRLARRPTSRLVDPSSSRHRDRLVFALAAGFQCGSRRTSTLIEREVDVVTVEVNVLDAFEVVVVVVVVVVVDAFAGNLTLSCTHDLDPTPFELTLSEFAGSLTNM